MKLRSACCGGILLGMPVVLVGAASKHDKKMYYDYRPPGDYETQGKDCGESHPLLLIVAAAVL